MQLGFEVGKIHHFSRGQNYNSCICLFLLYPGYSLKYGGRVCLICVGQLIKTGAYLLTKKQVTGPMLATLQKHGVASRRFDSPKNSPGGLNKTH